jgi:hypothetical protein
MFKSICLAVFAILLFSAPIGAYQTEVSQQSAILLKTAIKELPKKGILKQKSDGYVYLKIPDSYVYQLFFLVKGPGFKLPWHIRRHTKIGAHISVMYKDEAKRVGPIDELSKRYLFEPLRVRKIRLRSKEYLILEVSSPQLEQLRMRYGLSPKLRNHEFHITLAERYL